MWEVAYASTTVGAKQTVSKTRAFEESPVDQIFVEPTKFRAEYIYSIPKSAWDAAKTAGSLQSIQSTIEGNISQLTTLITSVQAGVYYLPKQSG